MKNLLIYIFALVLGITAAETFSQAYTWEPLGQVTVNGTNGYVYAITSYNGKIIYGGQFTVAGTVPANNIASYDPATGVWSALGSGTNGEIHALTVRGAELIAGGFFTQAGGSAASNIARWNGTAWQSLGSGTDAEVNALTLFNGDLIAGGEFGNAGGVLVSNIARWDGNTWYALGGGVYGGSGDHVSAVISLGSNLYAAGRFTNAGSVTSINIAGWNGSNWFQMSTNTNERLYSLGIHNGELYAGGGFTIIGGVTARYLAKWNGSAWSETGGGVEDEVNGISSYKGELVVSGNFKHAGPAVNPVYVDRIAKFNGTAWQRMLTGMNDRVNTVYTFNGTDTVLYAGGEFSTAGGKWAFHSAKWGSFATSTVRGKVLYSDNNDTVRSGKVKILRMDLSTREIIAVDSANITNGSYILARVPRNDITLRVIVFPDDELDAPLDSTYVPTYYPSTVQWVNAGVLDPIVNLTNIDVRVQRSAIPPQNIPLAANISGFVYLNILPPFLPVIGGFPYWSGSVVYVKQDTTFVKFGVTNDLQQYSVTGLNPGTYQVTVSRLGYEIETRTVVLGTVNQDTVNFYLDTLNPIGIVNINTNIPRGFNLSQNYPNPFNPKTNIEFQLPNSSAVKITVFDMLGREVAVLVDQNLGAGTYKTDFDGSRLASGVYFYRLETNDFAVTKKMILIK